MSIINTLLNDPSIKEAMEAGGTTETQASLILQAAVKTILANAATMAAAEDADLEDGDLPEPITRVSTTDHAIHVTTSDEGMAREVAKALTLADVPFESATFWGDRKRVRFDVPKEHRDILASAMKAHIVGG